MGNDLDLRLTVMRLGKAAGSLWPIADDAPPQGVEYILSHVMAVVRSVLKDDEEAAHSLQQVFVHAARGNRQPLGVDAPDFSSLVTQVTQTLAELRARLAAQSAELEAEAASQGDGRYGAPTPNALELTARFARMDSSLTFTDAQALMAEVGFLFGPLWVRPSDLDAIPPEMEAGINALAPSLAILLHHLNADLKVFDEELAEYRTLTTKEVLGQVAVSAVDAARASSVQFFTTYPFERQYPADPVQRRAKQDARAAQREHVRERSIAATAKIIEPIVNAESQSSADLLTKISARLAEAHDAMGAGAYPPPASQPYGVSARGAELWVADALRWLGVGDCEVTQQTSDGGIDVVSRKYAVSVKHYTGSVPVEELREIFGVAMASKLAPMLWTSGSLTQAAADFAESAPVPVFCYAVEIAEIRALNQHAQVLIDGGF